MSIILYSYKMFISVFVMAFIIKIMDDYIDGDKSFFSNLIDKMEKGILPYILVLFVIAILFDDKTPLSLFISSYIIGMFGDFNRILTFRMRGWQESFIIFLLGIYFLDIKEMVSSFLIILAIQIIDDLIDIKADKYYSKRNLALKYGVMEALLSSIILLLIATKLALNKSIVCLLVFFFFQIIEKVFKGRI